MELLDTILHELDQQLNSIPKSDLIAQEPHMSHMLQVQTKIYCYTKPFLCARQKESALGYVRVDDVCSCHFVEADFAVLCHHHHSVVHVLTLHHHHHIFNSRFELRIMLFVNGIFFVGHSDTHIFRHLSNTHFSRLHFRGLFNPFSLASVSKA